MLMLTYVLYNIVPKQQFKSFILSLKLTEKKSLSNESVFWFWFLLDEY